MSSTSGQVALAVTWLWLGMVLAISFLEAPLKFRAPGLDLRTGLAIGRLVFRALNAVEALVAAVLVVCLVVGDSSGTVLAAGLAAVGVLVVQLAAVRPALGRRSERVLAGETAEDAPRSHAHLWYVGLEVVKVAVLVVLGVALF
ncbi:MAG: hypothetical protein QM638_22870 [Nocardioides sp.]|uniref:hypothetical protein n=1 Tax=Nocardioides sp. TaxID=35761 RepID=UPI0039E5C5E1